MNWYNIKSIPKANWNKIFHNFNYSGAIFKKKLFLNMVFNHSTATENLMNFQEPRKTLSQHSSMHTDWFFVDSVHIDISLELIHHVFLMIWSLKCFRISSNDSQSIRITLNLIFHPQRSATRRRWCREIREIY